MEPIQAATASRPGAEPEPTPGPGRNPLVTLAVSNHMIERNPLRSVLVACAGALLSCNAIAADRPQDVATWAGLVWHSAQQGDRGSLDVYLRELPPRVDEHANGERLKKVLEQYAENAQEARATRSENRDAARAKMHTHVEEGDVAQALTAAVEVQTLSDDLQAVLEDPEMQAVVKLARERVPVAEQEGDWLHAYELLYRLNVLFEHTGEYQDELERINRRLALLSYYAPHRLYELRQAQAKRFDEEPLDAFNEALVDEPKLRLEDMSAKMVRAALDRAAREHIEDQGWRPLLLGGVEGLELLATTPALVEAFPSFGDAAKQQSWLAYLKEQRARIDAAPDEELTYRACSRLLGDVVEVGEETLGLPAPVILREFGDGAMHGLDEFSEVIWPDKFHRFRQSTQGSFGGVGILIRHDDKRDIQVVRPLEGTPAFAAGIKPNDRIVTVDGVLTTGWSLNDAVDKIAGTEGTQVTLGIRREGAEDAILFPLTRDVIKIRSVQGWWKERLDANGEPVWNWFIDPDTRIAYIRVSSFNEDTYDDLRQAWTEITAAGPPNGLILDLRYNPGGLLMSAVDVSNLFVPLGVIVSGETKDGTPAWPDRRAEPQKAIIADSGVSTVILVNQGSASASEIVAGSLQAHGAAVVVGMRTFGKGSVQTVHQIARKALLKLTTQYYRLPASEEQLAAGEKGRLVHRRPGAREWGVEPDVVVNTTPQEIKATWELRTNADIVPEEVQGQPPAARPDITDLVVKGLDPQLETALLILQAKALGTPPMPADTRHARAE